MEPKEFTISATHRPHLIALDSVRGIAALSIVMMHFSISTPIVLPYTNSAYLMVDLFFVLSGFAIYYAYHDRLQTVAQLKRFIWLRFWRLYPIHFVMLLYFMTVELAKPLASLFVPIHHAAFALGGWKAIVVNLLLLQSFNVINALSFNGPSWSISSEFYIYILFGFLAFFLSRNSRVLWGALLICLTASIVLAIFDPSMQWTFDNGWVRGLAGFFGGVLTCAAYQRLHRGLGRWFDLGFVALAVLAAVAVFIMFKPAGQYVSLAIVPLSAILILLIALSPPAGAIRLLTNRPMRWLGGISYSIYMVHAAIGFGLGYIVNILLPGHRTIPVQAGLILLNIVIVVAVASCTYLWIEMPIRAWSRKPR